MSLSRRSFLRSLAFLPFVGKALARHAAEPKVVISQRVGPNDLVGKVVGVDWSSRMNEMTRLINGPDGAAVAKEMAEKVWGLREELAADQLIYGNCFVVIDDKGPRRVHPMDVVLRSNWKDHS